MKIRCYESHGREYWRADLGMVNGKRVQKQFETRAAAEAFLSSKRGERERGGTDALALTHDERLEFVTLRGRLSPAGATLSQAVDFFLKNQPKRVKVMSEAVAECIVAKRSANRRARYVDGLESYLKAFMAGRATRGVHEISSAEIEGWFVARGERGGTLASNLGRLSALFSMCVRRGYITVNPCDMIERVRVEHSAPMILTVEECEKILAVCRERRPKLLGYVTLCLFAGVRPEEAEKLSWSKVDLTGRRVVVDAAASKVHRRRVTELSENAVTWLKLCDRNGMVAPWKRDRRVKIIRRLRELSGVNWCQDIMRHTAASHWMAKTGGNAAFVADQLGNSPRVLLTNYRALVSDADCKRFWSLTPDTVSPDAVKAVPSQSSACPRKASRRVQPLSGASTQCDAQAA